MENPEDFFEKKIRPVFAKHCARCHGEKKQKAGLRLDSRSALLRGGESGAAVVPGKPRKSRLLRAVRYTDPDLQMPPDSKLPLAAIEALERWVADGAIWPDGERSPAGVSKPSPFRVTDEDRDHWAFRPLRRLSPPSRTGTERTGRVAMRSSIDRWILDELRDRGLEMALPTSRAEWLRRATFDLTGLPPSHGEVVAFVEDASPDAFAGVVDRLLGSPHFGEHWARHWLDLVRYTETAGHVQDRVRPHAWKYRDWVIDALNDDLPYDRFVREHIAGDLIEPRFGMNDENVAPVATGFLWFHEMHFRPIDPVGQRADQVDAQIDVIGKAFLGLTVSCARCHDHKFDPVSQKDYYALAGFLYSAEEVPVFLTARPVFDEGDPRRSQASQWMKEITDTTTRELLSVRQRQVNKTTELVPISEINFSPGAQDRLAKLRTNLASLDERFGHWAPGAEELGVREVRLHRRGDHKNLGEKVERRFVEVLEAPRESTVSALAATSSSSSPPAEGSAPSGGREHLAQRIADHPITARVIVNRVWQHLFGAGLVRTPSNFGARGEAPTHPELLEALSADFVADGRSIKRLVRRIVLSRAYRTASLPSARALEIDPENRWLSHHAVRRLTAEEIRDAQLFLAGGLDRSLGGPSVPPYVSPNVTANKRSHIPKAGPLDGDGRRSIYILVRRNFVTPFLAAFDFPDQGVSVARRNSTAATPQALAMMNSPFVHQQAMRWGKRISQGPRASDRDRLDGMFLEAMSREPTREEVEILLDVAAPRPGESARREEERWGDVAHVLFNLGSFLFVR